MQAEYDEKTEQLALSKAAAEYALSQGLGELSSSYFLQEIESKSHPRSHISKWTYWKNLVAIRGYPRESVNADDSSIQEALVLRKDYENRQHNYSFVFFYGLANLKVSVDEKVKEKQKEKQIKAQVYAALDRYRNGTLTLDDVMESEWRSYVDVFSKEDPNNEDLAAFAEITNQMYDVNGYGASTYTITVGTHPARVYAAQWLCKQPRSLIITNVSSANDLQTLLASSVNSSHGVSFDLVRIPVNELATVLSAHRDLFVTYSVREDQMSIRYSDDMRLTLCIKSVADKNKKTEALQKIQQLIRGFSENGDFGLELENETFDPSLDLSISNLRSVIIRSVVLTDAHIDCLRKITAHKLEKLTLVRCNFENDKVKQVFLAFLAGLSCNILLTDARLQGEYLAFKTKFDADRVAFEEAVDEVKRMTKRVEVDENDLLYTEFSEINCKAILALGVQENFKSREKPEFKRLYAIASIVINKKVDVVNESTIQGILWFLLHNKEDHVTVCGLQSEDDFNRLLEWTRENKNTHRPNFRNLRSSPSVLLPYVGLGRAKVFYYAKTNTFNVERTSRFVSPVYSGFHVNGFSESFGLRDVVSWIAASPNDVELGFSSHSFTLADIETLARSEVKKIRVLTIDETCQFDADAKSRFFTLLENGVFCNVDKRLSDKPISKEYQEYAKQRAGLKRIKALIEKYKNNTLEYAELIMPSVTKDITALLDSEQQKELSVEEYENLKDLCRILAFPSDANAEVNIDDDRLFRAASWLMSHSAKTLPLMRTKNVKEACALMIANTQNNHRDVEATVNLVVDDAHSVKISSWAGIGVTVSLKGIPQSADVFNQVVNSVSSRVRIGLLKDQFLPAMDLSNPAIDGITLGAQNPGPSSPIMIISAGHVEVLRKATQLRAVHAFSCEFDSVKTQEAFVDALLANENLVSISLVSCGLTIVHLNKITAYAESHPRLTKVTLSGHSYRKGEDNKLIAKVNDNEKLQTARDTFIKELNDIQILNTFWVRLEVVRSTIADAKDFHAEPECVKACIDALKVCAETLSCSLHDPVEFRKQLLGFEELLSRCSNLSEQDKRSVIDFMVTCAVKKGSELTNESLVFLIERKYTNDALLECQRQRFDALVAEFEQARKAKIGFTALGAVVRMTRLACPNSPSTVFQLLYDAYVNLADFCLVHEVGLKLAGNGNTILEYLKSIPSSAESEYPLAQTQIKKIFLKMIKGILLADSQREKSSTFQNKSLGALEEMTNNPECSIQDVIQWVNKFIDEASMIPLRDCYITNKGEKVSRLEELRVTLKLYDRQPLPSAPEKSAADSKLLAEDVIARAENDRLAEIAKEGSPRLVRPAASVYPPASALAPVAVFVPPARMEYPPPAPVARLVDEQRRTESAPVLQGVSPAPAPSAPQQEEAAAVPAKRSPKKTPVLG